ncbi:CLUMA_CG017222, isoform A [Clunio marinus]|uniref:CLUMA_CG017222, isoform A n=1 Tax=Clunio marinus TaxID=568069 RepID=A0A1J1IV70_9DIPT|nr:CLUMA_CG017222, isoform A [Clunio marinus]
METAFGCFSLEGFGNFYAWCCLITAIIYIATSLIVSVIFIIDYNEAVLAVALIVLVFSIIYLYFAYELFSGVRNRNSTRVKKFLIWCVIDILIVIAVIVAVAYFGYFSQLPSTAASLILAIYIYFCIDALQKKFAAEESSGVIMNYNHEGNDILKQKNNFLPV